MVNPALGMMYLIIIVLSFACVHLLSDFNSEFLVHVRTSSEAVLIVWTVELVGSAAGC